MIMVFKTFFFGSFYFYILSQIFQIFGGISVLFIPDKLIKAIIAILSKDCITNNFEIEENIVGAAVS